MLHNKRSIGNKMKILQNKRYLRRLIATGMFLVAGSIFAKNTLILDENLGAENSSNQTINAKDITISQLDNGSGAIKNITLGLYQFKAVYNIRTSTSAAKSSNKDGKSTIGQLAQVIEVTDVLYTHSSGDKYPWVKFSYLENGKVKTNYVVASALKIINLTLNVKKFINVNSATDFSYNDGNLQYNICTQLNAKSGDCLAGNVEPGKLGDNISTATSNSSFDINLTNYFKGDVTAFQKAKAYIALEAFYTADNVRQNLPITHDGKKWLIEGGSDTIYFNTQEKKWYLSLSGAALTPTKVLLNENPDKVNQLGGFPFAASKVTPNNAGGYDVTGTVSIKLNNIEIGQSAQRAISFKIDSKACLVGGSVDFAGSSVGNWVVAGNWNSSQISISFSKLVATSCSTGYLAGDLSIDSSSAMPYIDGAKIFSAKVNLSKEGKLSDVSSFSKNPKLQQSGTAISKLNGYAFAVNSIVLDGSLKDEITFNGVLSLPTNNITTNVAVVASNSEVAKSQIALSSTSSVTIKNIKLKVSKVSFGQVNGLNKMFLIGQIYIDAPFGKWIDLAGGVAIDTSGDLLATSGVIGDTGVTSNSYGGYVKIYNADLVKHVSGEYWNIRGQGKIQVGPKILGQTIMSNELELAQLNLDYDVTSSRMQLRSPKTLELPDKMKVFSLSKSFMFKAVTLNFVSNKDSSGVLHETVEIVAKLSSVFDWQRLVKRSKNPLLKNSIDDNSVGIIIFPSGETILGEFGIRFNLTKHNVLDGNIIKIDLTYKNGQVQGKVISKWLPAIVELGIDFGEDFGWYVGLTASIEKLPAALVGVVTKSLGKLAPVERVGLKIGYWKPTGATQRRAFVEVIARFALPPFPIVKLDGKLLVGFSWESSYRVDVEAKLNALVETSILSSGMVGVGNLDLGLVDLKMYYDMEKGDFDINIAANVGPSIDIGKLKLEAKASANLGIGYVNNLWSFYYDTSVNVGSNMDFASTFIDTGFDFKIGAGIAFGRNRKVDLYVPNATKQTMAKANISIPTQFSVDGGFVLYAGGVMNFYIDVPMFDKRNYSMSMYLYTHVLPAGNVVYVGATKSVYIMGDLTDVRIYGVRQSNGQYKFTVTLWDVESNSLWKEYSFDIDWLNSASTPAVSKVNLPDPVTPTETTTTTTEPVATTVVYNENFSDGSLPSSQDLGITASSVWVDNVDSVNYLRRVPANWHTKYKFNNTAISSTSNKMTNLAPCTKVEVLSLGGNKYFKPSVSSDEISYIGTGTESTTSSTFLYVSFLPPGASTATKGFMDRKYIRESGENRTGSSYETFVDSCKVTLAQSIKDGKQEKEFASSNKINELLLRAITMAESGGSNFIKIGSEYKLIVRFENHWFLKYVDGGGKYSGLRRYNFIKDCSKSPSSFDTYDGKNLTFRSESYKLHTQHYFNSTSTGTNWTAKESSFTNCVSQTRAQRNNTWEAMLDDDANWKKMHTTSGVIGQTGEYEVLNWAVTKNKEAAYKSTSMGKAQIMGFNHNDLNYGSATEMYEAMSNIYNFESNASAMLNFIKADTALMTAMKNCDWNIIAKIYNGAAVGTEKNTSYANAIKNSFTQIGGNISQCKVN